MAKKIEDSAPAKPKLKPGKGKIGFTVSNEYKTSPKNLWNAITKAKHTEKFFVDKTTGDFTKDLTPVEWYWKKWGKHYQWPTKFQKEKLLEFVWEDHKGNYLTTVTFKLAKKGKRHTELQIHEHGWQQADLKNAFDNCQGWTIFLCYLKAWVEEGIDLRTKKG